MLFHFLLSLFMQVLKTEMEKQKCGHQESFAELAGKHSKELEDLGEKTRPNNVPSEPKGVFIHSVHCFYAVRRAII